MPAVDILPWSPPAGAARAETTSPTARRESGADDFANAMKQALAPKEKSTPDKVGLQNKEAGTSRKIISSLPATENSPATVTDANAVAPDAPAASATTAKETKTSAEEVEKKSTEATADGLFPVLDVTPPPPIFLSLPLSGPFPPSVPIPSPVAKNTSAEPKISAVTALASGGANASASRLADLKDSLVGAAVAEKIPAANAAIPSALPLAQALAVEPGGKNNLPTSVVSPENPAAGLALSPNLLSPIAAAPAAPELLTEVTAALPEAVVASALDHVGKNAGTGVATTGSVMKKTENTTKVAGLDVKILPVGGQESPREGVLLPQLAVTAVRATENRSPDANAAFFVGETTLPLPTANGATTFNPLELPSLTDARQKSVERTHDMVTLHAMRLVESKSDVLSVVIKPAVGTELTLELRQHEGGVEAHAILSRGDFQFLNQHWPELQQRLEQRGIKLAPLGGEANFSQNDQQQQQRSAREEAGAESASAFAEFASVGGATARRALSLNGWESWA